MEERCRPHDENGWRNGASRSLGEQFSGMAINRCTIAACDRISVPAPGWQVQAADDNAAHGRLDVSTLDVIGIAWHPRMVSMGWTPRPKMATPFQLFCPFQMAP